MRMGRVFSAVVLGIALSYAGARAADWLNQGGDATHSGWQQRERYFTPENAKNLKLLWKRPLENRSRGPNSLLEPVMLGPIITHRGIKELAFVAGASNTLFAVDDDLGRVFWTRKIEVSPEPSGDPNSLCGGGLTAAPAIEPDPAPPAREDDDYRTKMRPVYVLSSDGHLHKIHPATGLDMGQGWSFLKPGAHASGLTFSNNVITTETSGGCGGVEDGMWSIHLPDGKVEHAAPSGKTPVTQWEDSQHVRWSYEVSEDGITAFKDSHARAWASPKMVNPKQPVVASGVLFVLSAGDASSHATLSAFDARTGRQLYSSGDAIQSFVHSSGLALANGHVTFGTNDNTLYCFGFPLEIF